MTFEERIELLKAVAECAPKEMGALFHGTYVDFVGPGMDDGDGPPQLGLQDDLCDASACFVLLDAIEKAFAPAWVRVGHYPDIQPPYNVCVYGEDKNGEGFRNSEGWGTTRAEAIARAFVAVFGKVEDGS